MKTEHWLTLLGITCTIIGTVTTWGFMTGRWTSAEAGRITRLEDQFKAMKESLEHRIDQAGKKASDAMSYVQGVETRLARECANRELTDEKFVENRREHDRVNRELDILRRVVAGRRAINDGQGD